MKAVVLTNLRQMELRQVPEPTIEKETDVLLKIEKVGICGSDVHYYETGRIGSQIVKYPYIIGHECTATVKTIGNAVTRIKVGEPVVVEPSVACHKCDQCKQGRKNTCRNVLFLGTPGQGDGCLCEYIVMPQENCFPTYGDITFEQGALCEPLSIGIYTIKKASFHEGASIAILGVGPIGLSVLLAVKVHKPGPIYVTDKIDERLATAQGLGIAWMGNPNRVDVVKEILTAEPFGVDVVFECCGQQEALDNALDILKPGGQLVIVGIPREECICFSADQFRRKELSIIYIRRQNHCVQAAIDLIKTKKVDVDFMITHRFPLEDTKKAFDLLAGYHDGVIKAMIGF